MITIQQFLLTSTLLKHQNQKLKNSHNKSLKSEKLTWIFLKMPIYKLLVQLKTIRRQSEEALSHRRQILCNKEIL